MFSNNSKEERLNLRLAGIETRLSRMEQQYRTIEAGLATHIGNCQSPESIITLVADTREQHMRSWEHMGLDLGSIRQRIADLQTATYNKFKDYDAAFRLLGANARASGAESVAPLGPETSKDK